MESPTIALAGLKPGMGSTCWPTRWNVSPIWASGGTRVRNEQEYVMLFLTFRGLFHTARDETDLTRPQAVGGHLLRVHDAEFCDLVLFPSMT